MLKMQKCNLEMNLRILYYSSLIRPWGKESKEVTEKNSSGIYINNVKATMFYGNVHVL